MTNPKDIARSLSSTLRFRADLIVGQPDDENKLVIFDPVGGRNYRVAAITIHILRQFDGQRTLSQVHAHLAQEGHEFDPAAFQAMIDRAV